MGARIVIEPYPQTGLIYGLHDGDGVIRYVGQTARGLRARIQEHTVHSRTKGPGYENPGMQAWLVGLEELHVRVLETGIPIESLSAWEKHHIQALKPDLNLRGDHAGNENGQRGVEWTPERRERHRERMRQWHAERRSA